MRATFKGPGSGFREPLTLPVSLGCSCVYSPVREDNRGALIERQHEFASA